RTHCDMTHELPAAQATSHEPQCATSDWMSMQDVPHFLVGDGHPSVHEPAEHTSPPMHGTPHPPQLAPSVFVSTHSPLQRVRSFGHDGAPPPPPPEVPVVLEGHVGGLSAQSVFHSVEWNRSPHAPATKLAIVSPAAKWRPPFIRYQHTR